MFSYIQTHYAPEQTDWQVDLTGMSSSLSVIAVHIGFSADFANQGFVKKIRKNGNMEPDLQYH